jgi:hypothetical protein
MSHSRMSVPRYAPTQARQSKDSKTRILRGCDRAGMAHWKHDLGRFPRGY